MSCLAEIEAGGFSQPVIDALGKTLSPNDQRLLRQIVLGVLRHQTHLDTLIAPYLKTDLDALDDSVRNALRIGCFQLRLLDRIPSHAAVSTTVEAFKQLYGRKATGFVNGVLRAMLRQPNNPFLRIETSEELSLFYSQPKWLIETWLEQLGIENTKALCAVVNQPAPLTIRPQQAHSREALNLQLEAEHASTLPGRWTPYALRLSHPAPFQSESFRKRLWTAQDEASQLVVELLNPKPNDRIWDVCAAPGGKTLLIDWLTEGNAQILASDVSTRKVEQMRTLSTRGTLELVVADGRNADYKQPFDKVLLDAPCTALGIVRRHPEIRWRRSPEDVTASARLQAALLRNAAKHVSIGGTLIYSVCSSMPQEGCDQIAQFLKEHVQFCCEPPENGRIEWSNLWQGMGIQLWPHEHGTDGFFATRLKRKE